MNLDDSQFAEFVHAVQSDLHSVEINGVSYDSLDKEPGTTGKKLVQAKINHYTALMHIYFNIDSKTENNIVNEESDIEHLVKNMTNIDVTDEDIQEYRDYIEDTVRVTSPLYHQCYNALLAITAYVYHNDTDQEFADWIDDYANNTYEFSNDQTVNYKNIKSAFDNYMKEVA